MGELYIPPHSERATSFRTSVSLLVLNVSPPVSLHYNPSHYTTPCHQSANATPAEAHLKGGCCCCSEAKTPSQLRLCGQSQQIPKTKKMYTRRHGN
ncbi:hypothetical protein COCVIDRAFT_91662 [Bipolaris victoriae FI3]|uniref:Uncharacterized protein n=1 Tax=Bipolaris victoriae (strain FI3) TaxID=930091 RepID=W7ES65_BIPV3|nr:hypothetical protein COCVIDRAFT_91662 [Bipolaris victoriae FI3]